MSTNNQLAITEKSVSPFITPKQNDIIKLIGQDNFLRETSFAIQAANSNSYLSTATPQSVGKAVWNVAITGLSLNPLLKLAYLTPRKINGAVEAVLMPSYIGLCKLITDTGSVTKIEARIVYKDDDFALEYGTETKLHHRPKFNNKDNNMMLVYAIATLTDGRTQFEVMTIDEINIIRDKSDGYMAFKNGKTQSAIWVDHYGEMCKKTVVKRLTKYLPKSLHNDKWTKVMQAVDFDNHDYSASNEQQTYIESLVSSSTYDERQRTFIMSRIEAGVTRGEAEKIIDDLKNNQLDPITQGGAYGQGDIKKHIHEITGGTA